MGKNFILRKLNCISLHHIRYDANSIAFPYTIAHSNNIFNLHTIIKMITICALTYTPLSIVTKVQVYFQERAISWSVLEKDALEACDRAPSPDIIKLNLNELDNDFEYLF